MFTVRNYFPATTTKLGLVQVGTGLTISGDGSLSVDMSAISLTDSRPVPVTIGGISAGTTFDNVSVVEILEQLFYPYQSPAFLSFSISGASSPLEVGDTLSANPVFNWTDSHSTNVEANSISIYDITGSTTIASGIQNNGSYLSTFGAVTNTSAIAQEFSIQGVDTHSVTFNRTYSIIWEWRIYYGENSSTSLDADGITGLRVNNLSSDFAGIYSFSSSGYKYLCYPSLFGTASRFVDTSTQLLVPFQPVYTVAVTNNFGVTTNYNVHRTTNILGGAINIAVS